MSSVYPMIRTAKWSLIGTAKRYRHSGTKAFWVLFDQGLVSLGNFVTHLMLARTLDLKSLGVYAILYELTLFLNSMQASMVLFPLVIRGAVADHHKVSRLAGRAIVLTFVLVPVLGTLVLGAAALLDGIVVGLWAMVAMTTFQLQETLRRTLVTQVRYGECVIGDAISYLGQATVVCVLAATKSLTLVSAFQAFAATSALAAVVQMIQVRPQLTRVEEAISFARKNWHFSRWVMFSNLTSLFTGSLFFWNLAFWHGRAEVGIAESLRNVIRLANPLMLAFGTVIVPTVARARGQRGLPAAKRLFNASITAGIVGLTAIFAIPMIWPAEVLRIFYPDNAERYLPYTGVLQIMTVATLLLFAKEMSATFLNAVEQPKLGFNGQFAFTLAMVFIAMPLSAVYGLWGMVIGATIAGAIHLTVNAWYIRTLDRRVELQAEPLVE
jgi:O-antigen/teichoic acid export membrane protein